MVNQTDQLKSVFGNSLDSPKQPVEKPMGFLNTDLAAKIKDKTSNSQPIMSPKIQEDVATPVKPLEKEIENYVEKVSQTDDPIQAVLYAGMLTKGMEKEDGYQSVKLNLDENIEAHRSAITEFFKNAIGLNWDPRDHAWCAAFVDATLTKIGADRLGRGEERVRARDYINYGEEVSLDNIREGDIIILDFVNKETGKRDGKGDHVGFHTTRIGKPIADNRISMLGGNQSYNGARMIRGEGGAVSVKGFDKADVLSVRRITRDTKPWEGVKNQNPLYFYQSKETLGYGFNKGGLETGDAKINSQMQSLMIPSADDDYITNEPKNFTARDFASDSWEETKERFMDAGKIDVDPEDPALFTAYKRSIDYFKDMGLSGLGLADTAFKYAVGSVSQVMPTEQLEKRMARDLYSIPEAFAGMAGARSLTQLDDAADAFMAGSKQVVAKSTNAVKEATKNISINKALSLGKTDGFIFTGKLNLVHGYNPPKDAQDLAPTFTTSEKYGGERYGEFDGETPGGSYGTTGVYLENPSDPLFFNSPEVTGFYAPKTALVAAEFNKAFILRPDTLKELEKITGINLKNSLPKIEDGSLKGKDWLAEEQGAEISAKLKELGYDGLIVKDFFVGDSEISVYDKYRPLREKIEDRYKKKYGVRNQPETNRPKEGSKEHQQIRNLFLKEDKELEKIYSRVGIHPLLTQPQIIHLKPETLKTEKVFPKSLQSDSSQVDDMIGTQPIKGTKQPEPEKTGFLSGLKKKLGLSEVSNEIKNIVSKNTDEYVYVIHGGADFEGLPDLSNPLRTGESKGKRGINPLGEGMYGVVVDSTNVEQALASIGLAQHYGKKYGTSARFKDEKGWQKDFDKNIDEMFTPGTESYREQFGGEDLGLDEARNIKFGAETIPGQLHLFKIKKSDFEGLLTGDALNKARQKGLGTVDSYKDSKGEPVKTVSWEMVGHFGDSGFKVKEVAIKNPEVLERVGKFSLDVDLKEILKSAEKEPQQFAQGGSVMNNQMEMAFMNQGGLKDDGMRQDPVSGNPIPNGSMAEEVRDDIPAQLSEGEYVVPADVVRYYGVKHFEDIRNNAKQGLQSMEANGRIGGEPVPVGGPKAGMQQQMASDLNQDEMQEIQSMMMAVGGFVEQPNDIQKQSDPYQQQQTMYQQPMAMGANAGTLVPSMTSAYATTPTVMGGGFSFEPPQQAAPAIADAAKKAAEEAEIKAGETRCKAIGKVYNKETKLCEDDPKALEQSSDKDPTPTETPDPTAWMDSYNYNDPKLLSEQITAALTPGGGEGGFMPGVANFLKSRIAPPGSVLGMFSAGSVAAQSAANIMALEKIGGPTKELKELLTKFKLDNKLGPIEDFITGVDLFKDIENKNPNFVKASKRLKDLRVTRTESDKTSGNYFESLEAAKAAGAASRVDPSDARRGRRGDIAASRTDQGGDGVTTTAPDTKIVKPYKTKAKVDKDTGKLDTSTATDADYTAQPGSYSGGRNTGGLATRRKTKGK